MKALRIYLVGLAALALSGCLGVASAVSVLGSVAPHVQTAGNKVVMEGTRALIIAHNAYQFVGRTAAAAIRTGKVPPATVDRIEKLNDRAGAILEGGGAAQNAASRAAELLAITDEMQRLIGK